jgi:hypothetical protein
MTATFEMPRPSKLWKSLSEERRLAAAVAFWADDHAVAEHAEMIGAIARHINFRPRSVMALPVERRARFVARFPQISDQVAARLLVAYHLTQQRPMLTAFLDELGLKHEDGILTEEMQPPPKEAILSAGRKLTEGYPADDVRMYFSTLLLQDPDTWGALQELLQ